MLARKRLLVTVWLFFVCSLSLVASSGARSLDSQGAALKDPEDLKGSAEGEGDDYLDDYIGVNEDTIGIGRNGKLILEDIFGSGLKDDEEIYKEEGIKPRKHDVETVTKSEARSFGDSPLNVDVQGTIEQVEKILAANPELPRLSREEILEIYQNITKSENNNEVPQSEETVRNAEDQTDREENKKSLLVVLPFNANGMKDSNIEELFTKRPVTQIVGAEFEVPVKVSPIKLSTASEFSHEDNSNTVIQSPVYKPNEALHTAGSQVVRPTTNLYRQVLKNHNRTRPIYSSTTRTTYTPTDMPFSTRQTYTTSPRTTYTPTVKPFSSVTRSTVKPYTTPLRTTYRTTGKPIYTSTTKHTGQTYAPTPNPDIQYNQTLNLNNYKNNVIHKNRETATTQRPTLIQYEILKRKKPQPSDSSEQIHKTKPKVETRPAIAQYQQVNPFKPMPPPKHGVTKSPNVAENYLVGLDSNKVNTFRPLPSIKLRKTTPTPPVVINSVDGLNGKPAVRPDIQSVLASLGLYPDDSQQTLGAEVSTAATTEPVAEMFVGAESLTPDMKETLESLGLLPASSNIQPVIHQDSTLKTEPAGEFIPRPASSSVDVESYSSFKPLPSGDATSIDDKDVNGELKQILENFGLVPGSDMGESTLNFDTLGQIDVSGHRGQKALPTAETENKVKNEKVENKEEKKDKVPDVNMDVLSDDMKNVLIDLGLVTTTLKSTTSTDRGYGGHIFNPVEQAATLNHTDTQIDKLNELISTIQLLAKDNVTFTKEELDELNAAFNLQPIMEAESENNKSDISKIITKDKNGLSLDQILDGPDPLASEELINLYVKNEVKRQQPENGTETNTTSDNESSSSSDDTSTTTASSSDGSTTETSGSSDERVPALTNFAETVAENGAIGDGGASLTDLEESFGGESEDLKQKRPNGLYFLLDWNSYLEVGEEGKNKTIIRFTPKVGNPKNFVAVTVP